MKQLSIDINADLGEGIGNDAELMPYLTSCNIACGGHFGDHNSMNVVVELAKTHGVKIGAHPSFPDKENFGRKEMQISAADLYSSLKNQIRSLFKVLRGHGLSLHHIKPHGALYNLAAKDQRTAQIIIEVVKSIAMPVKIYAPYKSQLASLAVKEQIPIVYEGFADRNYNSDLSLVSRSQSNALLTNSDEIFQHVYRMITKQNVLTFDGLEVPLEVDTICVHSDTPNAIEIVKQLHDKLSKNHIKIR